MSDRFLVLGLGSLGQHCVAALKEFGVYTIAIEQGIPQEWEIANLRELLDELILGDCCQDAILQQAGIDDCRAALITTNNERANAEAALAIRQLNPNTRLVIRSSKDNLNQLLSRQLGNFIAFDPTQLPAAAFAIAALGTDTLGFFNLEGSWLRVAKHPVTKEHRWSRSRRPLYDLNNRTRRLLLHFSSDAEIPSAFYTWQPETAIAIGDTVLTIETAEHFLLNQRKQATIAKRTKKQHGKRKLLRKYLDIRFLKEQLSHFWQLNLQEQIRRVALLAGFIVLILLGTGTLLFNFYHPDTTLLSAFYVTAILLLGGYADLFDKFDAIVSIPWWLQLFALSLTLAGTAFVGVLYALLTEALLSSKFQFIKQRPPIPQQDHVVLIGLGRIGTKVANLLQEFQQTLVGITFNPHFDLNLLPKMPLLKGDLERVFAEANIAEAKSVIVATDDEMVNLEVALMARSINPRSQLAIRTYGQRLSNHLEKMFPDAQILCTYAVMAEAFAGAAFGENILSLFRLYNQTILVTEYQIEAIDTLHGLLIGEIAYGYGVVPIVYQKPNKPSTLMPSDDIPLEVGDRLVVLANIEGLRRVEEGDLQAKTRQLHIEKAVSEDAIFEGANIMARICGCSLKEAREFMHHIPATWPQNLYEHQGYRLVRELKKARVKAKLLPFTQNERSRQSTHSELSIQNS
ncbi:MAG: NAD-binding protein [Cyanobacteria bacterium SBLK]|nr:NAD-binding protein [Cyanobacteria bacterium SBLK]